MGALTANGGDRHTNDLEAGRMVVAPALVKRYGKGTDSDATDAMVVANTLKGQRGRGGGGIGPEETLVPIDIRNALRADGKTGVGTPGTGIGEAGDPAFAVTETSQGVASGASVRRLTPTECERLQGFPDGWTDLGGTPDSRRYAALGDAVTVPVAEWIGRRIRGSE